MCDEEFIIEDHEDAFRDYYCNSFRCSVMANNGTGLQDALEEYIRDLNKELYIFQEHNRTAEDICSDLEDILRVYGQ